MKRLLLACTLASLLMQVATLFASELIDAVRANDRARIKTLLAKQADVNAKQVDGMTALHWTAQNNDIESSKLLLKAGADRTLRNSEGRTPLQQARHYKHALLEAALR